MLPRALAALLPAAAPAPAPTPAPARYPEISLTLDDAYARYVPYVAKLGFKLLGRSDEVDDLVQDVFVIATERFATLRDPGALRGWLAAITVRTAVRRLRRRRLRRLIFAEHGGEDSDEGLAAVFNGSGGSSEDRRLLVEIFTALERVPARDRVAWALRVLEEEPLERVASLCGCSLSTAKRRVQAAQTIVDAVVSR